MNSIDQVLRPWKSLRWKP